MARLRGTGLGLGWAMGTAAIVRVRGGIPMLPPMPQRVIEQLASRRSSETPEVILVAQDYQIALTLVNALSWAKVVGIAAALAEPDAPITGLPAVVNVLSLLEQVEDDMLMLVDAEHGVVIADPDGIAIAQYQSEHDHIAPRRRLFLDGSHLPAHTVDGHTVQVLAWIETTDDISEALDTGADALVVTPDYPALPNVTQDETVKEALLSLAEKASGKPILLLGDNSLPMVTLLQASARADITLAVPPRPDLGNLGLSQLQRTIEAAEAECQEEETPYALPRLALDATTTQDFSQANDISWVETAAESGAARLFFGLSTDAVPELLPQIEAVVAAASAALLPVLVRLSAFQPDEDALHEAITLLAAAGVAGITVEPAQVATAKTWIREMNYSEEREAMMERLSGQEGSA